MSLVASKWLSCLATTVNMAGYYTFEKDYMTTAMRGYSKWFEPRSISSLSIVIVRVGVVLTRTVGDGDLYVSTI